MIQCWECKYIFPFFSLSFSTSVLPSLFLSFFIIFILTLSSSYFFLYFPLVDLWYPLTLAPYGAVSYAIGPDASSTDRNRELMMCGHFSTIAHGVVETSLKKCLKRRVNNIIKYFQTMATRHYQCVTSFLRRILRTSTCLLTVSTINRLSYLAIY